MIDIHGLFDKNLAEEFSLDVTEVGNGRDRSNACGVVVSLKFLLSCSKK